MGTIALLSVNYGVSSCDPFDSDPDTPPIAAAAATQKSHQNENFTAKTQAKFHGGSEAGAGRSVLSLIGNGPNTVSGSTVSNTELSEFFGAH